MNKKRVNEWIAPAAQALEEVKIVENGKIDSSFRGQIASFGAAVAMGSLKAATAFFTQQGSAKVRRELLLSAIFMVITGEHKEPKYVFKYVCEHDSKQLQEQFIDAAIALKLAMNLYDLDGKGKQNEKSTPAVQ